MRSKTKLSILVGILFLGLTIAGGFILLSNEDGDDLQVSPGIQKQMDIVEKYGYLKTKYDVITEAVMEDYPNGEFHPDALGVVFVATEFNEYDLATEYYYFFIDGGLEDDGIYTDLLTGETHNLDEEEIIIVGVKAIAGRIEYWDQRQGQYTK